MTGLLVEVGRRLAERWLAVLVLPGLLLVGVLTIGVLLGQADALSANRLINVATESAHRLQAVGGVAVGMAVVAVLLIAGACGWPRRVEPTSPRGMARRLAAMVRAGAEPPDSQAS
ncbi:MAG TPA: hypothetical protein VFO16_24030 [Pseudonocardiaceae bacterium]|nr:hypothetical protein [Pseudonocardiaceae bacterium]